MSEDMKGGTNYALVRSHYDCDEYISLVVGGVIFLNGIPFTATEDYHVIGSVAYLNDTNIPDPLRGWTLFTHGQPAAPAYLAPILAVLGVTWPALVPAFESKDILFWADQDAWVRFEGASRARHFIPANTYMRFHRRHFIFWVQQVTVPGTLRAYIEG